LLEILTASRRGRYPSAQQATLSESVRTLVSALLCSDPMQRASLADVRRHEWMNDGGDDSDSDDDDEEDDPYAQADGFASFVTSRGGNDDIDMR
jgi:serine/threonine protein kinase